MELIKRNTKESALTWDEIDENWLAIEQALNNGGQQKLYQLEELEVSTSCTSSGENRINMVGRIKILKDLDRLPVIKACISVNGKIEKTGASTDIFIGCTFPFIAGTTSMPSIMHDVEITLSHYPASVCIYVWDEAGNFAEPYMFTISENPCAHIVITNCAIVPNMITFTRELSLTATVKGSGSYKLQYKEGLSWIDLESITNPNGELTILMPIENSFPVLEVPIRLIDQETGFESNQVDVNFAFADWYAWHIAPSYMCGEGEMLTIGFYIAKMPASGVAIEYEAEPGIWMMLQTFSYDLPINLNVMGGGTFEVDIPAGTYNLRLRNLLTGKTHIAENVVFADCSLPTYNVTIGASVLCNDTTGFNRKILVGLTIDSGGGEYKVQYYNGTTWEDLHSFIHSTGVLDIDFYVPSIIPAATYDIRVLDISDDTCSNTISLNMSFTDSYEWLIEPSAVCDGSTQKMSAAVTYTNIPESNLIIEVYEGGSWREIASAGYTTMSETGIQNFDSPFEMEEAISGTYNVRLRNSTTGTTLLMADVTFTGCPL